MSDKPSFGLRILSGCVPLLVLSVVLGVVVYRFIPPGPDARPRMIASAAAAIFLTIGLSSFWSLARGFGRGEKSSAAMLRRAQSGETPADGETILVTGTIRSLAAPLQAPFSETPCVAYLYNMFFWGRDRRNRRIKVPVYWGFAAQPFAVDGGAIRRVVRAVPRVEDPAHECNDDAAVARASSLVRSTKFEEVAPNPLATAGTAIAVVREMLTDDDGFTSHHWKRGGDERDPAGLILEETLLPVGASASVLGTWSATRGAIVADANESGNAGVIARTGPPEDLLASSGQHSFTAYLISAAVFTAIGLAIVWFSMRLLPRW